MQLDFNINPFSTENPMGIKDAAKLATILAIVLFILGFVANAEYQVIIDDPAQWCFDAVKNFVVEWAGTFFTLAGLEQLIKAKEGT